MVEGKKPMGQIEKKKNHGDNTRYSQMPCWVSAPTNKGKKKTLWGKLCNKKLKGKFNFQEKNRLNRPTISSNPQSSEKMETSSFKNVPACLHLWQMLLKPSSLMRI